MMASLVMGVVLLVSSLAFGDSTSDSLMKRVNKFCATEFNGDEGERIIFFLRQISTMTVLSISKQTLSISLTAIKFYLSQLQAIQLR
jgi:hypothetical protein